MKEYKILTANSLEQAEQVMNDMAQAGWETVSFTPDAYSFPRLQSHRRRGRPSASSSLPPDPHFLWGSQRGARSVAAGAVLS